MYSDTFCLLWNLKDHFPVQTDRNRNLPWARWIQSKISHPISVRSVWQSFLSNLFRSDFLRFCLHFLFLHACSMSYQSIHSWLHQPNYILWGVCVMKLHPSSFYFNSLSSKYYAQKYVLRKYWHMWEIWCRMLQLERIRIGKYGSTV
jgi:hypothetical protein